MSKSKHIAYALQRIEELTAEVAELKKLHGQPAGIPTKPNLVEAFRRGMEGLASVDVIRYLRRPSSHWRSNLGGVTLAFRLDYTTRVVTVAYSICSEEDNFDKAIGTLCAMKRLDSNFDVLTFPVDSLMDRNLVGATLSVLANYRDDPSENWNRILNKWSWR